MYNIMIFDSGVGGLSIAEVIIQQIIASGTEKFRVNYLADDLFFPYGELSEESVVQRIQICVLPAVAAIKPDILVVACNTASTIVLPVLRAALSIPVVGVVPAIKPAASQSLRKHIGLLATPATIQRSYTDELIAEFADDIKVTKVGSTELVEMAERYLGGEPVSVNRVAEILAPFFGNDYADVIVLGCTHFPLLKRQFNAAIERQYPKNSIKLVDSAGAVSRRVMHLLGVKDQERYQQVVIPGAVNFTLYSTGGQDGLGVWREKLVSLLGGSVNLSLCQWS